MTRFPRPHGWLQWVAVAAAVLCLAVGIAAVVVLTGGPGDVSHPDVEFTAPPATTQAQQPPQPTKPSDPGFRWPFYGYDKERTRYLPLQRPIHPPYKHPWYYRRARCSSSRPCSTRARCSCSRTTRELVAIGRRSAHVRWGRHLGHLAAASPAVAGRLGLLRDPRARARDQRGPRRGGQPGQRAHALVAAAAEPCGVLAAGDRQHAVLRQRERDGLRAAYERRLREVDLPRQRRRQGWARDGLPRAPVLRRLRGQGLLAELRQRPPAVEGQHERRSPWPLVGPVLRDRGGRLRPRVPRQHRRLHVLLRVLDRQARVAHPHGRLRLRLGCGGAGARRPADGLLRVLRPPLLRARRALRCDALGAQRPWPRVRRRRRDR